MGEIICPDCNNDCCPHPAQVARIASLEKEIAEKRAELYSIGWKLQEKDALLAECAEALEKIGQIADRSGYVHSIEVIVAQIMTKLKAGKEKK